MILVASFFCLAYASLEFDKLCRSNRQCFSSYSPDELRMGENTRIKLHAGVAEVEGLSDMEYLFWFREGSCLFPHTAADQGVSHELRVEEGDDFIWFGFNGQAPQTFLDAIYVYGLTEEQLLQHRTNDSCVIAVKISREVTVQSRYKNMMIAKKPCFCGTAQIILYIFISLAIIGMMFGIVTFDCWNPRNNQYVELIYYHRSQNASNEQMHLYLQTEKACWKQAFTDAMMDRVRQCLLASYPNIDPLSWILLHSRPFIWTDRVSLPVCGFNGNISNN